MKRIALATATALVATLALGRAARADDPAYVSVEDLVKKRGTLNAAILVVAKDDSETSKTVLKLLADPKLAKAVKEGLVACRIDTGDEKASKAIGIPVEKEVCVLGLDGYLLPEKKHEKALNADTLVGLVKAGTDATAKKKKTEKDLDKAEAKAEDLAKKQDYANACQQLLAIADMKSKVPCEAVDKAEKKLEELKGLGLKVVTEARTAVSKKDFSTAHKKLAEAQNNFPIPAVLEECKAVSTELGNAERAASGK